MINTLTIESGKINFIRTGPRSGNTVVLLHPMGMDLTLWGDQILALKTKFDVIALDLPGHGFSGRLEGEHSFENLATVIVSFIENISVEAFHLVGISYGGMIAQEVAIRNPDLVLSLTLIATACTFPDSVRQILRDRAEFTRNKGIVALAPLSLARWFTPEFSAERPDVIDRITKLLYLQDAFDHATIWDTVASLDSESRLGELSLPALIIVGDKDASTPIASAEVMAKALKSNNIQIVKNAAHFPMLEKPELVNNLLLTFFDSL